MSIDVYNSMNKLTKPTFVEKSKFKIDQQDVNYGFINVATCNFKGKISGVKSNYEQMIKLIDEASNNQSKIILFPELCLCSYTLLSCSNTILLKYLFDLSLRQYFRLTSKIEQHHIHVPL